MNVSTSLIINRYIIIKKDDIVLLSTYTKHIFNLYMNYRANTFTFWAVKEGQTMGCLVN